MTSGIAERNDLIFRAGLLLAPLYDALDETTSLEWATAVARVASDTKAFQRTVTSFCTRPGHRFSHVITGVILLLNPLRQAARKPWNRDMVDDLKKELLDLLGSVPIDVPGEILAAHSPFSAYVAIRDRCLTASKKVTLVDKFLDETVFFRYLRGLRTKEVVLVTKEGVQNNPAFIDLSRLFGAQRSAQGYRLVVHPDKKLHDRHLRCDDMVFNLGPSTNSVAERTYATLSAADSSSAMSVQVDLLESTGTELFGPANPSHP